MKQIVITLFCLFCVFNLNSQTYYYKLQAIETNGNRVQNNGSGLYITFTANGCYDSDSGGCTMNNGFQQLQAKNSDRIAYNGSSYWGNAQYVFSPDYSVLNVCVGADCYIYYRDSYPAVDVSTYVGKKKEKAGIISPGNENISNQGYAKGMRDYTEPKTERQSMFVHGKTECPTCKSSGKCTACNGKGWYENSYADYEVMNCSLCHGGGKCQTCKGKGYIRY